jgi:phospholipid/cholesterol/gamma-HCH transport system substrate-binding protein
MRLYLRHTIALAGIIVLALGVTAYVAVHQRLRFPWEHERDIYAEFSNAQAVTPGQGQTVTVAGVQVGEIGDVKLENGLAVVQLRLTSKDLGSVYRNAHLLLRPKTGLKDMSVELDPGTPERSQPNDGKLSDGDRLPVWNTLPDVNPDEVLGALDQDTRSYLATVATAGGQGLKGRGPDLRRLIAASEPTFKTTKRVMAALADRRQKVARLVTNLRTLSRATANKNQQLADLVSGSSAVFSTIADHEAALGQAVQSLPGALHSTNNALGATRALAGDLQPALEALRPTVRELGPAAVDVRPLFRQATPTVRDELRPLVRDATPLVRKLRPSVDLVNRADPNLIRTTDVLNHVVNELGYNPPGPEEGYLFWTAWFFHNASSILSVQDAHGATWRGLVMISCSTAGQALAADPALAPLTSSPACPKSATPQVPAAKSKAKAKR